MRSGDGDHNAWLQSLVSEPRKALCVSRLNTCRASSLEAPGPAHTRRAASRLLAHHIDLEGNVTTLDADTDRILDCRTVPSLRWVQGEGRRFATALGDPRVLVAHGPPHGCQVDAYRLADFSLLTTLEGTPPESPQILIPPASPHLFVAWPEGPAQKARPHAAVAYDRESLGRLGRVPHAFVLDRRFSFSPDGTRLYSWEPRSLSGIRILDGQTLRMRGEFQHRHLVEGSGGTVHDVQGDHAVIVEDRRPPTPGGIQRGLFTVRLTDGVASRHIQVDMLGAAYLTPQADRILYVEQRPADGWVAGRLHVFEVATGRALGVVPFPARGYMEIELRHPGSDRVYLSGPGAGLDERTLTGVSLRTLKAGPQLTLPVGPMLLEQR